MQWTKYSTPAVAQLQNHMSFIPQLIGAYKERPILFGQKMGAMAKNTYPPLQPGQLG
jgi:hypothetical protein